PCVLGGAGTPARRRLCSNRFPPWEGCRALLSRLCGKSYPQKKPRFSRPFVRFAPRTAGRGTLPGAHVARAPAPGSPAASSRLRRQGRELLAVVLPHARGQAILRQRIGEHLPHGGVLVGIVELVAADAAAHEAQKHTLRVARRAGIL